MHRKVVTVLFCDVIGSTALGESIDPEALRAVLARYFEDMKARAAAQMREAFSGLGVEGRIGLGTGEVVTGTEERLATGDTVNVAARLQQAAAPGEVLIDEATLTLVREAVEIAPVDPLALKGKSEPVPAIRLLSVLEAPERRHETPFVGRGRELALVAEALDRVQRERRCELVTIVGDAGVGKSRLAAETLASIDARVVRGRCLPYGEGITYWPVVEVIKQLGQLPSDPTAAAAIRSLLGETEAGTSAEEIGWAFRKLLEEAAPIVVVLDDLQWGEETFLDLVEHVALLSSGAQILLLCMTRPELLDRRPSWPVTVRLEPLPEEQVQELIGKRVPADLRDRIARAAGGNPLFVAEMLAMAEEAGEDVPVPPSLKALFAARLDQLETPERRVLECGAVEGEIFHRGPVQALAPEEPQVTPRLAALVRKELIRPETAQLPGDDGFRFRHLLIRDAAYDSLPKATRAELHERFAAWLEQRGPELVELDEILGYHLEQAARYKAELGQPDSALAKRAAARLAVAGRRAGWRGDARAAIRLIERALALTRPLQLDVGLELDLATQMDPRHSVEIARAVAEQASAAGDPVGEATAEVAVAFHRLHSGEPVADELEALADATVPLLEEAGDHAALANVWWALGQGVGNLRGRYEYQAQAAQQALHYARLVGEERTDLFRLDSALIHGPRRADEALKTLDAVLPDNAHPRLLMGRAVLLAMLGRFDEAWPIAREASERIRELTGVTWAPILAHIAVLAGDHDAAMRYLQPVREGLERQHRRAELSTYAPLLGRSLCALGRHEEAEPLAALGRELGDEHDFATQMLWRQVQAVVLAHRGEHEEAERLAREAVTIGEQTDALTAQGEALFDLAEVLEAGGRPEEAAATFRQALERFERKKNLALAAQVRPRLTDFQQVAR